MYQMYRSRHCGVNVPLQIFNKIIPMKSYNVELMFYYFAGRKPGRSSNVTVNIFEFMATLIMMSFSNYTSKLKCKIGLTSLLPDVRFLLDRQTQFAAVLLRHQVCAHRPLQDNGNRAASSQCHQRYGQRSSLWLKMQMYSFIDSDKSGSVDFQE